MTNKLNRPATVWLTQALLLIFALLWSASLLINLLLVARDGTAASPARVAVGVSALACFVLLLLIAFRGLAQRRLYGKWLGVFSLVCLWLIVVYIQVRPPSGPLKRFEYNSPAELLGAIVTALFVSALFLTLIFRLAFAKSVDGFFERHN